MRTWRKYKANVYIKDHPRVTDALPRGGTSLSWFEIQLQALPLVDSQFPQSSKPPTSISHFYICFYKHTKTLSLVTNPNPSVYLVAMPKLSSAIPNQIRCLFQSLNEANVDSVLQELCQVSSIGLMRLLSCLYLLH